MTEEREHQPPAEQALPDVVELAIRTATIAHRNQRRKGCDMPYIAHPAAVASILIYSGIRCASVIAAAWLHDVVEDTPLTIEEIREQFPANVADIVEAMSETKDDPDGNRLSWSERKAHHIERMRHADEDTLAVMLADKLHNLKSMQFDLRTHSDLWDRFNATKEDLLGYYRSMIAHAEGLPALKPLHDACESLLAELTDSE